MTREVKLRANAYDIHWLHRTGCFWEAYSRLDDKKLPAFCETWSFISVFTKARHWMLFIASWILSKPSHPVSLRSTSMLGFIFCFYLPSGFFCFEVFRPKLCVRFSFPPCVVHVPLFSYPFIWWKIQMIMFFSFSLLNLNIVLKRCVHKHPSYMFFL